MRGWRKRQSVGRFPKERQKPLWGELPCQSVVGGVNKLCNYVCVALGANTSVKGIFNEQTRLVCLMLKVLSKRDENIKL